MSAIGAARADEGWRQRVAMENREHALAAEGLREKVRGYSLPELGPPLPTSKSIGVDPRRTTPTPSRTTPSQLSRNSRRRETSTPHSKYSIGDSACIARYTASEVDVGPSVSEVLESSRLSRRSRGGGGGSSKGRGGGSQVRSGIVSLGSDGTSFVTSATSAVETRLLQLESQLMEEKRGRRAVQDELAQIKSLMKNMKIQL